MAQPNTRRGFLRQAGAVAAAAVGCGVLPRSAAGAKPKKRPNILFLFTDDQTYRSIGSWNNPEVKTPNLDRLFKRSTVFTHCFNQGSWSGAVCICSRAMVNSGLNLWHAQKRLDTTPLWGETFTRAGYETFMTGKWHNGPATLKKSFTHIGPTGGGMFPSTKDAYQRPAKGNTWSPYDTTLKGHWRPVEGGGVKHSSELWADAAIKFLKTTATKSEKPFFMYVAFHAPHDPRQSPKKYVDMYPPDKVAIPPNFLPEHPFDQGDHRLRDEMLAPFPRTRHAVQVHRQEYYAIITHADYHIGRILDALDAAGKTDDTIILYSADHGLAVGEHGLMGKQNQYDCSVRMPLTIAGPGVAAGKQIDAMVYLSSLFATTCEMTGVPVPKEVEQPSLVPLMTGKKQRLHDAIYGAYKGLQRMVRTDRYKLILYPHNGEVQLFDLKADPWETKDLAEDPAQAERVKALKAKLRQLQKEVGDTLDIDSPPKPKSGGRKKRRKTAAEPAGTPGAPVGPGKGGALVLAPKDARTTGMLRYQADRENLGAWQNPKDTCTWNLVDVPAGTYQVEFTYGSTNPGVAYTIEAGAAKLTGKTQSTGGIKTYKPHQLGTIRLPAGKVTLTIRPGPFKGAIMNYRSLRLTPVK